ncbi:MAG: DUF6152 family protein [Arenicellaceae bacterium]|nr:DUF6152 family protein [Arenicellaceae bacterium]
MRNFLSVLVVLLSLLSPMPAVSHHSFSAEFDIGRPVELTGTVTSLEWTNPHTWVFIDTEDEQGNKQSWAIELLGINVLLRSGMTPKTVKPDDVLTITGYGSRDGTNTANASSVTKKETGELLWASAGGRNN